jgi:hypothetical protein
MIEAEILKEKFRVVTDTMRTLKRQRFAILGYLTLSLHLRRHSSRVGAEA